MLKEESLVHYVASFCYDAFQFCVLVCLSCPRLPCMPSCLAVWHLLIYGPTLRRRCQTTQTPKHGFVAHGSCPSVPPVRTATRHACSRCTGPTLAHIRSRVHYRTQHSLDRKHRHRDLRSHTVIPYCDSERTMFKVMSWHQHLGFQILSPIT